MIIKVYPKIFFIHSKINYFQIKNFNMKEIFILYLSIIILAGTFLNLTLLVVYCKFFKKYESIYLYFSLAIVNLLSSCLVSPMVLLTKLEIFITSDSYCRFYYFLQYFINTESFLLTALISFERYNKLDTNMCKFKYKSKIATIVSFLAAFIFSCLSVLFYKLDNENKCIQDIAHIIVCSVFLMIIFIFICFMYINAYLTIRRRLFQITGIETSQNINQCDDEMKDNAHISKIETFSKSPTNINSKINKKSLNGSTGCNLANIFIVQTNFEIIQSNSNLKHSNKKISSKKRRTPTTFNSQKEIRKDWKVAKTFILVSYFI